MLRHFAWSVTYKRNFADLENGQNPDDLRILALFSDLQNFTVQ
jgi:hypothetical protein